MTILYICKLFSSKGNGVVVALNNEIKYLQGNNNVALYNLGVDLDDNVINNIFYKRDYKCINDLPKPYNNPDLVVFEEIYKIDYIRLYNECLKRSIPYIIIPHGSLVKLEQKRKFLKKKVANLLLFNRFLKKSHALQFLNEREKQESIFSSKNSLVIPNGIEFEKVNYNKSKKFKYVFIGRYSVYTKGLDLLLKAFSNLKEWCETNNVVLEMYGWGPEKDIEQMNNIISSYCSSQHIRINGPVYGEEKKKALEEASVFIQTSRHEGQPMGIIEALSRGIPCIVTEGTSFKDYCNKNNCGIGIDFELNSLEEAIKKIHDADDYERKSENAKECSYNDFEIKKVTKLTESLYKSLYKN